MPPLPVDPPPPPMNPPEWEKAAQALAAVNGDSASPGMPTPPAGAVKSPGNHAASEFKREQYNDHR